MAEYVRVENCPRCSKTFQGITDLKAHLFACKSQKEFYSADNKVTETRNKKLGMIETSKGKHPCSYCSKVFTSSAARSTHTRRIHENIRPYKCDTCGHAFHSPSELTEHKRTHTGAKPYSCPSCDSNFTVARSLWRHMRIRHHKERKPHKCDTCGRAFYTSKDLKQHQRTHTGEKPYSCHICENEFTLAHNLRRHVQRIHQNPVKSEIETGCTCELCPHPKYFNDVDDLEAHLMSCHHIESENAMDKFNRCGYTGQEFKHEQTHDSGKGGGIEDIKAELNPEENMAQTGEKRCLEDTCKSLNQGYSGYKNVQEKRNTKFSIIETSNGKLYPCRYCTKVFTSSPARSNHTRRIHEKIRPYKCDTCGHAFHSPSELTEHKRTHTGAKPYSCPRCDSNFTVARSLWRHMRIRHHKERKPHKCDTCGRAFYTSKDLKQHQRTHAGEKPYSCHICENEFTLAHNLRRHVQRIHQNPVKSGITESSSSGYEGQEYEHEQTCDNGKEGGSEHEVKVDLIPEETRAQTGEKRYRCRFCGAIYALEYHLESHVRLSHGEPINYELSSCSTDSNATLQPDGETTDGIVNRGEKALPRFGFILDGKMLFAKVLPTGKEGTTNYLCKKCGSIFRSDEELCVHYSRHHKLPTILIQKL